MRNAAQAPAAADADVRRQREQRAFRRARRKVRAAAGEIKELNIVAMMDMMTILLVFLLKSYQASAVNVNMGQDLMLPTSTAERNPAENVTVTVTTHDVRVNDQVVLATENGLIPAAAKDGGKPGAFFVSPLYDALKRQVDLKKRVGAVNSGLAFKGQVNLVADKKIPYRTLMEVLYTAGQAELGEYQLMVLKNE